MRQIIIRKAQSKDCAQLLGLMQGLAEFEGYRDSFKVTVRNLRERGFKEKPDFYAYVAEFDNQLIGMLVYYYLPFTYDLKPWMLIKELFVEKDYRTDGVGKKLMQAVSKECLNVGASRIKWDVLTKNYAAKQFYIKLGAELEEDWRTMSLSADKLKILIE